VLLVQLLYCAECQNSDNVIMLLGLDIFFVMKWPKLGSCSFH